MVYCLTLCFADVDSCLNTLIPSASILVNVMKFQQTRVLQTYSYKMFDHSRSDSAVHTLEAFL